MININKVQLQGNLTRDPELKANQAGIKVCKFTVATNRSWKDSNGDKREEAQFTNCIAFNKQAEVIAQWMKSGSEINVEGRIKTREYTDPEGVKKWFTEVIVESFQFGNKPEPKQEEKKEVEVDDINPDDVPF